MSEVYGDRPSVGRAVARVLQSQADWGTLERVGKGQRMVKRSPIVIDSEELTEWLIEAAVRYIGRPVSISALQSLPVLFPLNLSRPLAYVASNSRCLELRSEGTSNQIIALSTSHENAINT